MSTWSVTIRTNFDECSRRPSISRSKGEKIGGRGGVQEEKKKKKEMESTRDREKKHGTRLVPCSSFFRVVEIGTPAEGPPLSVHPPPSITTPLNGFKRPRRRQWGRHATGPANLPHQLAKKFLIYRPTDFYPPLGGGLREDRGGGGKWRNLVLGTHGEETYAWDFVRV